MDKKYIRRLCPRCNVETEAYIENKSKPAAEDTVFNKLVDVWIGFFKDKIFFSYYRCKNCKLLFCRNYFTKKQLSKLYSSMSPNMSDVPISALKKTQHSYYESLKKFSSLTGNYLEIGPDIGLFTQNIVNNDQIEHYWMFEPNTNVENNLKNLLKGKKYTIVNKITSLSDIPNSSIDTCVLIHVIDHLEDPRGFIKQINDKLKQDGRLLIVCHNERSFLSRILKTKWPPFCLQHPQLFNKLTLKNLIEDFDLKVIYQDRTINYFNFYFLLKHFLWLFKLKTPKFLSFINFNIGLRLGNIITIAKK